VGAAVDILDDVSDVPFCSPQPGQMLAEKILSLMNKSKVETGTVKCVKFCEPMMIFLVKDEKS
jgi:hypothetical protein